MLLSLDVRQARRGDAFGAAHHKTDRRRRFRRTICLPDRLPGARQIARDTILNGDRHGSIELKFFSASELPAEMPSCRKVDRDRSVPSVFDHTALRAVRSRTTRGSSVYPTNLPLKRSRNRPARSLRRPDETDGRSWPQIAGDRHGVRAPRGEATLPVCPPAWSEPAWTQE